MTTPELGCTYYLLISYAEFVGYKAIQQHLQEWNNFHVAIAGAAVLTRLLLNEIFQNQYSFKRPNPIAATADLVAAKYKAGAIVYLSNTVLSFAGSCDLLVICVLRLEPEIAQRYLCDSKPQCRIYVFSKKDFEANAL